MEYLSDTVKSLQPPATIKIAEAARELSAKGFDVISLSIGEPDFNTPDFIKEAAKQAIDENFSKYPPVPGFVELREAISRKFKRDNNIDYDVNEIVVSTGAKQSIINTFLCLLNKGDEVIIPAPFWVSYFSIVQVVGGNPKIVKTTFENDFKITPEQLEEAITPKTKVLIFSTPSNPTGGIYSKKELEGLAVVIKKHSHLMVISDEIYEYINYGESITSIASLPGMKEQAVTINGISKAYAMTGYRIGYLGAPKWLAKAVSAIQSQYTSGASSISQRAAIVAIESGNKKISYMIESYKKRKDLMYDKFSSIEGFNVLKSEGAFYIFIDTTDLMGKNFNGITINNAEDLSMYFLHNAHVAVVHGDAFGLENSIRISYAASEESLLEAYKRIKKSLNQ